MEMENKTEKQISKLIEELIYEYGGESMSFSPIVASGPNSADPHHASNSRIIKKGDIVVLDYGAKYKGYCSDITRTIAIGEMSEEAKKIYNIVREAQQNGIDAVKKGILAKDIDYATRKIIASYGYGLYFIHRTGHGIGLDVHEDPFITSSNSEVIQNGMVFTIEPGIYLPNKFGIRIEDDVLVNEKGISLTSAPKDIMII